MKRRAGWGRVEDRPRGDMEDIAHVPGYDLFPKDYIGNDLLCSLLSVSIRLKIYSL